MSIGLLGQCQFAEMKQRSVRRLTEWDSVGPLAVNGQAAIEYSGSDELANDKALRKY